MVFTGPMTERRRALRSEAFALLAVFYAAFSVAVFFQMVTSGYGFWHSLGSGLIGGALIAGPIWLVFVTAMVKGAVASAAIDTADNTKPRSG